MFEGRKGVNAWLFAKCCFGWVITLVVVGTTTALLVGPSPEPLTGEYCDNYCQVNSREWMQGAEFLPRAPRSSRYRPDAPWSSRSTRGARATAYIHS